MDFSNEWITVQQALTITKYKSRTSLYKYLHRFNIRASKPMGRVYYNLSDILATIEANAVKMGI